MIKITVRSSAVLKRSGHSMKKTSWQRWEKQNTARNKRLGKTGSSEPVFHDDSDHNALETHIHITQDFAKMAKTPRRYIMNVLLRKEGHRFPFSSVPVSLFML